MYLPLKRKLGDLVAKLHTAGLRLSFARLGGGTTLCPPLKVWGEDRISVGERCYFGPNCWLMVLRSQGGDESARIEIGSRVSVSGDCTITACREVVLEDSVLMGRFIHISDHSHEIGGDGVPIKDQGIRSIRPVRIREGAWIGQGAVICPGVTVGRGAVVGANSVVRCDVPDRCVVAGAPARIVRRLDGAAPDSAGFPNDSPT